MCLRSGLTRQVDDFQFLAVQLRAGAVITGAIYPETYTYNAERDTALLRQQVESFLGWLEQKREFITDKKIFNNV
jgi:hypothetical protein